MFTAAAANAAAQVPPARRRRKLVVVGLAVLALCAALGVAFVVVVQRHWLSTQTAQSEDETDSDAVDAKATDPNSQQGRNSEGRNSEARNSARVDLSSVPVYVSLEPFTVNLADRDTERMAQVGVTLEISDLKVAEQIKDYMPAVRNHVLMAIADRNAAELLGRDGKARLAQKIIYEVSRTLGYDATNPDSAKTEKPASAAPAQALGGDQALPSAPIGVQAQAKRKGRKSAPSPIKAVHFSAFIVQ